MIVPKSHRVRHKILSFLAKNRHEQQLAGLPSERAQFTIEEMATAINESVKTIDAQLNVLWEEKEVINQPNAANPGDPRITKYMILSKGISTASSMSIINEGKIINSQLFNNYASAGFQIIVGIIAILTVYQSLTTIEGLKQENIEIRRRIELISEKDRIIIATEKNALGKDSMRLARPMKK